MGRQIQLEYARRRNKNGTTDLICLRCFRTVFNAMDEVELSLAQREHACEGFDMGEHFHP